MLMRPRGRASSGGGSGGGGKTGPANIGLLTNSVTHSAATSCRDALVDGGHTVTLIADSDVGSHDYTSYDLILTSRTSNADRSAIAAKLTELNDAGMPLIVGTVEAGLSPATGHPMVPTEMGITGTLNMDDKETQLNILDNTHAITSGMTAGANTVFSVGNYIGVVGDGQQYLGTRLADGATALLVSNRAAIVAMEAGEARLTSGVLGARIVLFPTYLISGAYTELHRTLLNQAVEWAI